MKTKHCNGNILIVAAVLIVVVSILVGVSLHVTSGSAQFADRSRDFASVQAAAEGAVEYAFAVWKRRVNAQNRAIDTVTANAGLAGPAFPGFSYAPAAEDGP